MDFPLQRTSVKENFPFPQDGAVVLETPPTLIWVPVPGARTYTVAVKNAAGQTVFTDSTEKNFLYDRNAWQPGCYTWDIIANTGARRGWQSFTISPQAVHFRRPDAKTVYESVPAACRPRHLFAKTDVEKLMAEHGQDICILQRNVQLAYAHGMPEPPRYHLDANALPYREYFGNYRDYCDRDLIACALLYALTGDAQAGAHGKKLLLTICSWDPEGPCSLNGAWGDEVGLSNARCLPSAFDLLYDLLDEAQICQVTAAIGAYARQCQARMARIDYARNPSNSHVGRLPAYLGEAALVLKGTGAQTEETLMTWLETALEIYNGIFPFYGGADGSWAEGAFYASSYTKWFLPFFSAVERFSGFSLFDRPFYMRFPQYLLHFCNPRYEVHPFGDGYWCHPNDAEWPGFFAQNPYRVYAERFGPPLARQRLSECADVDYFRLHLLDIFLPKPRRLCERVLTGEAENAAVFPDGGFAVMHTDLRADDDICVMMRASRFTADSHRHADQGSFALFCGGKALITPSGYFGRRFGSQHHFQWTRTTVAHNVVLIDAMGQCGDVDAVGRIVAFDKENRRCRMDLSSAYRNVRSYFREITLDSAGITVTDIIEADDPVTVTYPLHTLVQPEADADTVTVCAENCLLTVTPLAGDLHLKGISDRFGVDLNAGEPEDYHVVKQQQYHIYYEAARSRKHTIQVRFSVQPAQHEKNPA